MGRKKGQPPPPMRQTAPQQRAARAPRLETSQAGKLVAASSTSISHYQGPLPSPEYLREFEQVVPGLADRIVRMAEKNASHRQELEAKVVGGNVDAQERGQWFAFVLALAILAVGAFLTFEGRTFAGLAVMFTDLVGLAGVFATGRLLQLRERADRRRELEERTPPGERPQS